MTQQDFIEELTRAKKQIQVLHQRLATLEHGGKRSVPDTMLLNDSFLKRAFAVLGHSMVASIIIALPFYALMFFILIMFGLSI